MKQTYKLTSDKLDGHLRVTYINGLLKMIELAIKTPLSEFQFDHFVRLVPYKLDLDKFRMLGLRIEVPPEPVSVKKIALFCVMYKKYVGTKYKVSRSDAGKIADFTITEAFLNAYFQSERFEIKGKYSISNLVRYYNELRADIVSRGRPRHPNTWSQEYAAKLQPTELGDYWSHLRTLGLKPKKDKMGNTVDWVK